MLLGSSKDVARILKDALYLITDEIFICEWLHQRLLYISHVIAIEFVVKRREASCSFKAVQAKNEKGKMNIRQAPRFRLNIFFNFKIFQSTKVKVSSSAP